MSGPAFLVFYAIGAAVLAGLLLFRARLAPASFRQLVAVPVVWLVLIAIADLIRLLS